MDNAVPKKSLGQHWLTDPYALDKVCEAGNINPDDIVLEIGSGLGYLTELLVDVAGKVIAVELDNSLIGLLKNRLSNSNLSVVEADILKYDLRKIPKNYKVVANIPYYLTSNLLRVLCESSNPFSQAVLLVQKEVAERVAAKPGDMGILSISVQLYCDVVLGDVIPAGLFEPPPKVDSRILILHRRDQPLFDNLKTKEFFRIVKAGFSQKRKTLINSLSSGLRMSKDEMKEIMSSAGIKTDQRPQTLSLDDWYQLYKALTPVQLP